MFFQEPDAKVLQVGIQNGRLARLSSVSQEQIFWDADTQSSVSQEQIFWDADTQILEWRHGCLAQMNSLLHRGHTELAAAAVQAGARAHKQHL